MKRDIRDVRKSIAKRKQVRGLNGKEEQKTIHPSHVSYLQEEERHGYMPFTTGEPDPTRAKDGKLVSTLLVQSVCAAVLFLGVATLFRSDVEFLEKPKLWAERTLTEDFQFATVNSWYEDKFGEPLTFLPNDQAQAPLPAQSSDTYALPVAGTITETFEMNGQGIVIETTQEEDIYATDEGVVTFAGKTETTDNTVIIQHADKSQSYYGYLSSINVHQYENVDQSTPIGKTTAGENGEQQHVYFAIKKGDQFIDPVKVMQVDEQP
ncbi:stage IV sporulation protein FA [Pontibacillus halophilus JSM 076056 = DSM 19796]|uniref:Stage IV sporulation protein FA n=1 Tax=Pontibacillus halophilus JSM 076056 = DSM 19796 TaxID=1385510 RepID=A0A0A5GJT5_9BACI|nr:M23 family metallopeptidase [Pontibacillus halophilus]KGX93486.1 stage IV sporulation protein FA [Pontibacillus halophilus JSM 076056 = DSM 19796]